MDAIQFDISLLLSNCLLYNREDAPIVASARKLVDDLLVGLQVALSDSGVDTAGASGSLSSARLTLKLGRSEDRSGGGGGGESLRLHLRKALAERADDGAIDLDGDEADAAEAALHEAVPDGANEQGGRAESAVAEMIVEPETKTHERSDSEGDSAAADAKDRAGADKSRAKRGAASSQSSRGAVKRASRQTGRKSYADSASSSAQSNSEDDDESEAASSESGGRPRGRGRGRPTRPKRARVDGAAYAATSTRRPARRDGTKREEEEVASESVHFTLPPRADLGEVLASLFEAVVAEDSEGIFAEPVTDDVAPGYSQEISRPTDLQKIR